MDILGSLKKIVDAVFAAQGSDPSAPTGSDVSLYAKSSRLFRRNATEVTELEVFVVTSTRASPTAITAGGGITAADVGREIHFIQGDSGAVDITVDPQISVGTVVGHQLILIGRSDVNTVKLDDATGLALNGNIILGEGQVLALVWDGTNWLEQYRKEA